MFAEVPFPSCSKLPFQTEAKDVVEGLVVRSNYST